MKPHGLAWHIDDVHIVVIPIGNELLVKESVVTTHDPVLEKAPAPLPFQNFWVNPVIDEKRVRHAATRIDENLEGLIQKVKGEKADLGIAYDGDGDRIGVVNEEGNILWGDELMILFSRDLLKRHPGAVIISEVKCSQRLFDQISLHGAVPIMWKAGHSLLKAKMKETHALLAGEMSGHMFFADRYFGYDDAIYASLRLLEL